MCDYYLPITYSHVPIKSLKYECLSKLGKMMRKPKRSTNNDQMPVAPDLDNNLNLPIEVAQQIIDYLNLREIPVRFEAFCALLSGGGCNSFVHTVNYCTNFNVKETIIILNILTENASILRSLHLYLHYFCPYDAFPFKQIIFNGLQRLEYVYINTFDGIIAVFAACPNLIELGHVGLLEGQSQQEIDSFFEEVQKPTYNQIRGSLRTLRVYGVESLVIRFVALFSNLSNLNYEDVGAMNYPSILYAKLIGMKQAPDMQQSSLNSKEFHLILNEVEKVFGIFAQLKALGSLSSQNPGIFALTPNLESLRFNQKCSNVQNLNEIGNLKHLKSLSIIYCEHVAGFHQILLNIFEQIGDNLEELDLRMVYKTNVICIATIARYCPNLKRLHLFNDGGSAFYIRTDLNRLNMANQERENLKRPFRHLKELNIECVEDLNVFSYILRNAVNIERIQIGCSPTTEAQWTELMENNPLKNLRFLIIFSHSRIYISETFFIQLTNSLDKLCYAKYSTLSSGYLFR